MPRDLLHRALAVALLVVGASTAVSSPAHAAATPVIQTFDYTSVPGHVSGTISAPGSAFVSVDLGANGSWPGANLMQPVDPETGLATYDLETWGFTRPVQVGTAPCTTSNFGSCDVASLAVSDYFTPTDVAPSVTWPEDTTIGLNPDGTPQDYTVTVADPEGGGDLRILFDTPDDYVDTVVDRNGTTSLSLTSGAGTVLVKRCQSGSEYDCKLYLPEDHPELSRALTVKQTMKAALTGTSGAVTSVDPTTDAVVDTDLNGAYALDWRLSLDGTMVTEVVHQEGTLDTSGDLTVAIDGSQLPDGYLGLVGTLTVTDPDFGVYTSTIAQEAGISVDRTPPGIDGLTISRGTIHPNAIDALAGYRSVSISLMDDEQLDYSDRVEIRNSQGNPVRHLEPNWISGLLGKATWDGRNDSGTVVPEGTYTVVVVDLHGNVASITRAVTVSHDAGVLRTFRRTVSAAGSLEAKFVGACSTLRKPSLRGWTGSLGYYANTRCGRATWNASAVTTLHAVRLPLPTNFVRYHDERVDTYGGAARLRPRSMAVVRYLRTDGKWVDEKVLGSRIGTHAGARRSTSGMVDSGRWLAWGAATAYGNRYDVKSFTVTVRYFVWS